MGLTNNQRQNKFASCLDDVVSALSRKLNRNVGILRADDSYIFYLPRNFAGRFKEQKHRIEKGFQDNYLAEINLDKGSSVIVKVINRNAGYLVENLIKGYCEEEGFNLVILEDKKNENLCYADFERAN
ncbi:MAG: hypothetical protein QXX68_01900 [Candidatus Pacearchaeota archaeon]